MQEEQVFRENASASILCDGDPRTVRVFKPWLDETDGDNVLFTSVHLHGNNFYPNTGGVEDDKVKQQEQYSPGGIFNFPMFPGTASCNVRRKTIAE